MTSPSTRLTEIEAERGIEHLVTVEIKIDRNGRVHVASPDVRGLHLSGEPDQVLPMIVPAAQHLKSTKPTA